MKKYNKKFLNWLKKNDIDINEFLPLQLEGIYEEYLIEMQKD